jgi:hypothetical protein
MGSTGISEPKQTTAANLGDAKQSVTGKNGDACQISIDCSKSGNGFDKSNPNYHSYDKYDPVCSENAASCTVDNTMQGLIRNYAPGADGETAAVSGTETEISFMGLSGGHVVTYVDMLNHRILNFTERDHIFYNGVVIRSVVEGNGLIGIRSFGEGINSPVAWPSQHFAIPGFLSNLINQATAGPGWRMMDNRISNYLMTINPADKAWLDAHQQMLETSPFVQPSKY